MYILIINRHVLFSAILINNALSKNDDITCEWVDWHASACGAGIKIQRAEKTRERVKSVAHSNDINQDEEDLPREGRYSRKGRRRNIERVANERKKRGRCRIRATMGRVILSRR